MAIRKVIEYSKQSK